MIGELIEELETILLMDWSVQHWRDKVSVLYRYLRSVFTASSRTAIDILPPSIRQAAYIPRYRLSNSHAQGVVDAI